MDLNEIEGTVAIVVEKIFPDIESYRAKGHKMTQIYAALSDKLKSKMTLGTFRNAYYRERSKIATSSMDVAGKVPGSNPVSESSFEQPLSSLEKATQPSASQSKKPKRVIDFSQSLEEHQAIARADFNRK